MYTIKPIEEKYNAQVEQVIRACLMEMGHTHEGCAWTDPFLGRFSEVYAPDNAAYWVAVDADDRVVGGAGIGPWPCWPLPGSTMTSVIWKRLPTWKRP